MTVVVRQHASCSSSRAAATTHRTTAMFIGHFAVGFAAKRATPRTSLGMLVAAPILLDLIWPIFLLLGWERVEIRPGDTAFTPLHFVSYPYSHSLLMAIGWGAALGLMYGLRSSDRRGATILGLLVVSHWVLDLVTHRADLPIYPGGMQVGLGLWNSVAGTVIVEALMFVAGVAIYVSSTTARDRIGKWGLWSFVALLAVLYTGSFGPPPGSARVIAWVALVAWLLPFWAAWADRHRLPTIAAPD